MFKSHFFLFKNENILHFQKFHFLDTVSGVFVFLSCVGYVTIQQYMTIKFNYLGLTQPIIVHCGPTQHPRVSGGDQPREIISI